jgi:hypothetical protein
MKCTSTCLHCGDIFQCDPHIKNQKYCSKEDCQQARRRAWKKKQYHTNKTYRKKHLESQRVWRKQRPAHQYQKEYRSSHPDYVIRNRELQKVRNKKRQKNIASMIVNGNALSLQPSITGAYALFEVKKRKDCKWELVHDQNAVIIRGSADLYLK